MGDTIHPSALKPHPLNKKIYGAFNGSVSTFNDLRDSIKEKGILVPILITKAGVVISGHSRLSIANLLQLKEVPVSVFASDDELDIAAALIHANRGREKTAEQKAREFKELRKIEAEKAKKRQATSTGGKEPQLKENLPEAETDGQSRDIAAAQVGWSGKTAERAAAVVDRIDALDKEGESEKANELRATLNKSVNAAHKATHPELHPEQPIQEEEIEDDAVNEFQLSKLKAIFNSCNQSTQDAFVDWVIGMAEK